MSTIAEENAEAIEAWNGVLFDRFLQFRHIVTTGLGAHGEAALRLYPPEVGARVLDIGCGFGDTTQRLAELVGPEGEAVGVDAAERFIDKARQEPEESDEPTCGPGPFSMADADTTTQILVNAGFEDVALHRSDIEFRIGEDIEEAVALTMALGPAGRSSGSPVMTPSMFAPRSPRP